MKKINLAIVSIITLVMVVAFIGVASAETTLTFNNFVNNYKVFHSANCDIQKTKTCPSELGWQGSTITFKFKPTQITNTDVEFDLGVGYWITTQPIDIYANNKRIITGYVIADSGDYIFSIPSSYFKAGKSNSIKVVVRDVKVGYGKPSTGFVISQVSVKY